VNENLLSGVVDQRQEPETIAANVETRQVCPLDGVGGWQRLTHLNDTPPICLSGNRNPSRHWRPRGGVFPEKFFERRQASDEHVCIMQ
jgi:hypothetical protein